MDTGGIQLTVSYEWTAEEVDQHGDIVDSDFADKLSDLAPYDGRQIGLVRNVENDADGVTDRTWAYPAPDMPEYFENGLKVPARYAVEWRRSR